MKQVKNLKRIIYLYFAIFITKINAFAENQVDHSEAIKMNILPNNVKTVIQWEELKVDWTTSYLDLIISWVMDGQIFFGMISAITVFIILWWKLLTANWDEEKHSEAIRWFIYVWVWLALIPLGWAIIRLVTSISFN